MPGRRVRRSLYGWARVQSWLWCGEERHIFAATVPASCPVWYDEAHGITVKAPITPGCIGANIYQLMKVSERVRLVNYQPLYTLEEAGTVFYVRIPEVRYGRAETAAYSCSLLTKRGESLAEPVHSA